ncbi:MAG TPA: hypothetical protein HA232_05130 [Methanocellales archaeon]|nr:hypothetical protein [Methanocellales archaeon]
MENIHLIVAGNESIEKHVGALNHFKPYKVVLFNVADDIESKKIGELMQIFDSMKIQVIKKDIPTKYGEIFLAALGEVVGLRGEVEDVNFAVNVSTGRRLAVAAIEDAVRSPLGGDVICEAHGTAAKRNSIRYEVVEKEGDFTVQVAPLEGTTGISMNVAYKTMPFKKARLEKIEYLPGILPLKFQMLKNKWKRRLGLRK